MLIYNGTLVLPDKLVENGWLMLEDGRIADLGHAANQPHPIETDLDANGNFVLPGLIDLHCDAIEKLVQPRPNVMFDVAIALDENDRRLAGCGITTEFHAISLDDNEFGVRATDFVAELCNVIHNSPDLLVRHEIHARYEVTSQRGFEVVSQMIKDKEVRLVSLMDHSPGQGQYATEEAFRGYLKRTAFSSDEEVDRLIAMKREQQQHVASRIEAVTSLARENGLAIATHDDDSPAKIERWPGLGVTMSEFPTTMPAARHAHELGLAVCMGAPNVLRGKSSGGNLSALEAIEVGIIDVLCSDYYPAALLPTIFKLATQKTLALPQATRLMTLNAAHAVGLDKEFGSLELGKMADIIVVSLQQNRPRVQNLLVGGREKLRIKRVLSSWEAASKRKI